MIHFIASPRRAEPQVRVMFLIWIFMLSAVPNALSASSISCRDPEAGDQNTDHMTDCLGLRFTWLHSVFDNFPSLLSFTLKLRCATGLCPRDLEDYGCSCRYVASGNPVDPLDITGFIWSPSGPAVLKRRPQEFTSCCETHRTCYQNAAPCRQELPPLPNNFTCSAANSSCDAGDWCQQTLCECDQAAIDCMTQSSYNSTLRGLAESSCSASNQTDVFSSTVETTDAFRGAVNDSLSHQLSNSSFLSAEMDQLMTGRVENRSDAVGLDGDLVTPTPGTPPPLTPADLNEAVTEEALRLQEINKNQTTHNPPAISGDSVLFVHDRETLNESDSEPSKLSPLSFGGRNAETSSTPANSHADITTLDLTTTFPRTTTPREASPAGLEKSSEEGG
ncbi:otoconin-90-like [Anoplopoma fimbria]|uniref:otoconin-90-like n=1 Tax=Anoplopoma fimbria TaxID=229290 RepID=UPI0023EDEB8F|nr:otoconin-90-like [Anoplopoma fimbria]